MRPTGIPLRNGKSKVSVSTSAPGLGKGRLGALDRQVGAGAAADRRLSEIEIEEANLRLTGLREQLRLVLADLDGELRELDARAAVLQEIETALVLDRPLRALAHVAALDRELGAVVAELRGTGGLDPDAHVGQALERRLIRLQHRLAAGDAGRRRRPRQPSARPPPPRVRPSRRLRAAIGSLALHPYM